MRDALTLFDEDAAILQAPPVLVDALRARDWQALFVRHRAAWADARLTLFGHALMEKLVRPRPAITAHVWLVPSGLTDPTNAIEWLRKSLTTRSLAGRSHLPLPLPLPVLGVPGWWAQNEAPGFYDDAAVFRPAPKKTAATGPLFQHSDTAGARSAPE